MHSFILFFIFFQKILHTLFYIKLSFLIPASCTGMTTYLSKKLTLGSSYSLNGASPCAFPIEFT